MFGITFDDLIAFAIAYKWWIIALSPLVLVLIILKIRG